MMSISSRWLGIAVLASLATSVDAQERIYRCGNEYTNNATIAKERDCRLVEGGNITIVQGAVPRTTSSASSMPPPAAATRSATTPSAAPAPAVARVHPNDQKARDADAKAILEMELRKAEARLAELQKEYNQGEPERTAIELRNPALYQGRLQTLKEQVTRAENDVVSIRRELERRP